MCILRSMRLNNKQKEGIASICDDLVKATIISIAINQQAIRHNSFSYRLIYIVVWFTIAILFFIFSLLFRKKSHE